ncbi:MAG: NAD(P)/FAD-dependent oxidoreductase [Acidimicrobiales bacterium]|nr:NAD(P)/FAD-dependent oxidoreductase [Acidimicrobiales bacterium]
MPTEPTHTDVLIVGAGITGIGAGYYLGKNSPDRSYTILEGRADLGGTWDLFRYPGIRSDSDMHTLGYSFKPWTEQKAIADGPSILKYLRETAAEYGVDKHIRFNHQVATAEWSSDSATWTVTSTQTDTGESVVHTCNFLFMCSGYYSYKAGYEPDFPGSERFTGPIIHPQKWPEDLDYRDKNVIVIGSGATAVTIVPAMAPEAKHVTMLQRSPTYMISRPAEDALANRLRRFLPEKWAYAATRWKNIRRQDMVYRKTRSDPDAVRKYFLDLVRKEMGPDYDVDTHFTPTYDPWDQRLCLVPDSDFFNAVKSGDASIVTDHIESFTETGIRLESGAELEADIIITATGLQLVTLGEMDFVVDGAPVDFSKTWTYKGMAYSDVPNLMSTFGYVNASWTLRVDLNCEYLCRILNHMSETGSTTCTPRLRGEDAGMTPRPWIDDFPAGYMQRMMPLLPKQGDRAPWLNTQRYLDDKKALRKGPVDDGVMQFEKAPALQR